MLPLFLINTGLLCFRNFFVISGNFSRSFSKIFFFIPFIFQKNIPPPQKRVAPNKWRFKVTILRLYIITTLIYFLEFTRRSVSFLPQILTFVAPFPNKNWAPLFINSIPDMETFQDLFQRIFSSSLLSSKKISPPSKKGCPK